jgi:hypothetical protein
LLQLHQPVWFPSHTELPVPSRNNLSIMRVLDTFKPADHHTSMSTFFDCVNWRIVGSEPNCAINLCTSKCEQCDKRVSRNGNYQNPPVYYVPALHPEMKRIIFQEQMKANSGGKPCCQDKIKEAESAGMRGLGDVVAAATSMVGIKPCGGCKQRQEALNKMFPFGQNPAGGEPKSE